MAVERSYDYSDLREMSRVWDKLWRPQIVNEANGRKVIWCKQYSIFLTAHVLTVCHH